ncbi:MAG: hypothetical protein Q8O13_05420 [Candidatus Omnitrophota bacterium]|nr:hypothetical protein [Candidatus Omnitrophota bacterium]
MNIVINNPEEINKIVGLIHDEWFEKDDVKFNASLASLEIKLKRENQADKRIIKRILFMKKLSVPIVESILRISNVDHYQIEDTANIGRYDFNEIKYDVMGKIVSITSGFPLIINAKVKKFEVSLDDTGKVIEEKTFWSI